MIGKNAMRLTNRQHRQARLCAELLDRRFQGFRSLFVAVARDQDDVSILAQAPKAPIRRVAGNPETLEGFNLAAQLIPKVAPFIRHQHPQQGSEMPFDIVIRHEARHASWLSDRRASL